MSPLYVVVALQLSVATDCPFSSFVVPAPGMGVILRSISPLSAMPECFYLLVLVFKSMILPA